MAFEHETQYSGKRQPHTFASDPLNHPAVRESRCANTLASLWHEPVAQHFQLPLGSTATHSMLHVSAMVWQPLFA